MCFEYEQQVRYLSLQPEVKEMTPLADGNWFWSHKFLRKSGFYLTVKNLPIAHVELISGYLDCLRPNSHQKFQLDDKECWGVMRR